MYRIVCTASLLAEKKRSSVCRISWFLSPDTQEGNPEGVDIMYRSTRTIMAASLGSFPHYTKT